MNAHTVRSLIDGPAGAIECAVDLPAAPYAEAPRGTAVICHPHPQFGGTLDNKVVQTLARAAMQIGLRSVRFNFRGIGGSQGAWDEGRGEVDDALAVIATHVTAGAAAVPVTTASPPAAAATVSGSAGGPIVPAPPSSAVSGFVLAGFSFGGFVAAVAASRLAAAAKPQRLVLVGPSTLKQQVPAVPADTVVIHGESDDVVPLAATLDWARPQSLPVIVIPGVGHFFHGQLALLRSIVVKQLS